MSFPFEVSASARGASARSEATPSEVNRRAAAQQPIPAAAATPAPVAAPVAPPIAAPAAAADPIAAERAKAERLARIIVSDILLYNPEKFAAALRSPSVVDAMRDELEEGRGLFRERIDGAVRGERDHLAEELERVARTRRGR